MTPSKPLAFPKLSRNQLLGLQSELDLALNATRQKCREGWVVSTIELPRRLVDLIDRDAKSSERKRATQIRWLLKQYYEGKAS